MFSKAAFFKFLFLEMRKPHFQTAKQNRILLLTAIFKRLAIGTFDHRWICLMRSYIDMGKGAIIGVLTMMFAILNCTRNSFIFLHKITPPL